ncbi:right-handed parallel beta-helix repeat-containing protein [Coraliomargarita sp. W4R72]
MKALLHSTFGLLSLCYLTGCQPNQELSANEAPKAYTAELPRPEPLRELATTQTIHAKDFGAIPDDGLNDWEAIQKALDALIKSEQPTLLEFENGHYHLDPPTENGRATCFRLNGLSHAVIDGKGAEFTILNPEVGFLGLSNSDHVIVKNMSVDYDPLPYTQGWIRAIDLTNGTFDLEVADGFPKPDADYFQNSPQRWGSALDPKIPGRFKRGAFTFYSSTGTTRLSDSLFRIQLARTGAQHMQGLEVGDRYQEQARSNAATLFYITGSTNITYESVTIYASPAGVFVGSYNEAINFLHCDVAIKEGRWKSSNADVIHMQSNRIGPWVENCRFEGVMDDLINIYTVPFHVTKMTTPTKIQLGKSSNRGKMTQRFDGRGYKIGDTLVFMNPQTGAAMGERKILSMDLKAGTVIIDSPVDSIELGSTKRHTHVYNKSLSGNFVIRDNQFLNSRRYGIFLKASNGLIQGNHFEGLFQEAITLHNEPDWPEGPYSENIIIDSNVFKHCGFSGPYLGQLSRRGVVHAAASKLGHQSVAALKVHRNLQITNNQWYEWEGNALFLANTDNAFISNNQFTSSTNLSNPATDIFIDEASCANITIED